MLFFVFIPKLLGLKDPENLNGKSYSKSKQQILLTAKILLLKFNFI